MRIRKLMYDSFYSNNEAFSGVTSVDSLGADLFFHYTKIDKHWNPEGLSIPEKINVDDVKEFIRLLREKLYVEWGESYDADEAVKIIIDKLAGDKFI